MLNKHKYWRTLLGQFAEILIAKQVDYAGTGASSVDDFESFVADALEGEFGIFNEETGALIAGTTSGSPLAVTPAGTTLWLFAAVKRDGQIERTNKFRLDRYTAKRAAYAAAVAQVSTATFSGTPVAGKEYTVKIIETTPGHQPFPQWQYSYVAKAGDSVTTVMTAIKNLINDKSNVTNKNTDSIVTANNSAGVLTVTAIQGGPNFRIAFSAAALEDLSAVFAYTGGSTARANWGNGTFDQIAALEDYADVIKGVTTNFPGYGQANPEDFGEPTDFAASGVQYSVYILSGAATEWSPTPVEQHIQKHQIILAIPSNGTANADAEVRGILNV